MKLQDRSAPSALDSTICHDDYQALLTKANEQYELVEKTYDLYQDTLDSHAYAVYVYQLIKYARCIGRIRSVNPEMIKAKCQDTLDEAARLWAAHTIKWVEKSDGKENKILVPVDKEDNLTPEVVARHMFLLDTAQALGWEPPKPVATPTTGIRCYKSLQQFADGRIKKVGYCSLATRYMLSACIFEPEYCRHHEIVGE